MRINKTKKNSNKKTTLIVAISVLVALGIGASAYAVYLNSSSSTNEPDSEYGTNLERTDAEKEATKNLEKNPETKVENPQSDTPQNPEKSSDTGKLAVNVLLSTAGIYNGTVSVGGMVTDYQEQDGICTYVFTKGSLTLSKTSATLQNPTSMSCKTVSFPSSELVEDGIWKVKINYNSTKASGSSNEKEITK